MTTKHPKQKYKRTPKGRAFLSVEMKLGEL
jgi:hypothetical protein